MKTSIVVLASCMMAFCLSSCQSTFLLKEDFSGDVPGNQPIRDIPRDPVGDRVDYQPLLAPRLTIQSSSVTSGKSLVFSETRIEGATARNQFLSFKGIVSDYTQPVWFYWTAKQRNSRGTLQIDIMGIQGLWVTRLKIEPNGRVVRIIDYATEATIDVLGTLNPAQTHTIIISLQPAARKYNITLMGTREGTTASSRTNLDVFAAPDASRPPLDFERPGIHYRYQNESGDTAPAYVFEGVYISRRRPD